MNMDNIGDLYEYNRWANAGILDAAAKLTAEEFTKDLGNSYRSVRDTLVHIMSAEWIWLMRWKEISPKMMLLPSDFLTISALKAQWSEIENEQKDFLSDVTDESLEQVIEYVNTESQSFKYRLWQMMVHVVNHSSYHRGQITTMLRQLGAEPIATDFLLFYDLKSPPAN